MKKTLTFLLVFVLIACAFAGCKKQNNKPDNSSSKNWETTSGDSTFTGIQQNNTSQNSSSSSKKDETSSQSSQNSPSSSTQSNNSSSAPSSSDDYTSSNEPSYPEDVSRTIYYYNGNEQVFDLYFSNRYWHMPFAQEDDGTITKKGYVLLGYSFSKDGKNLIRPGYKYTLPNQNAEQNLYCVWAKETAASDFKTVNANGGLKITAYNGNDKIVYIPREIGGKAVTVIGANAFANNTTLNEVHITSSVQTVEPNAFASCKNLKTVTVYDNLKTISDSAFTGSPVKKVRLCAGKSPRYITSVETFGIKYERLVKTKGQKRVIVLAGSSVLYGIDSDYMESLFKDDITVINFGTNANQSIIYYLEAIAPHLTKNDTVIFTPEQYGAFAYHTNGNPELPSVTLQGTSTCYNLFENIDATKYTKVFNAIGQYCAESARMPALSWENYSYKVDEYGDLSTLTSQMNSPDFVFGKNGAFRFNESVIPKEFIPNLNRVIDLVSDTKAKIYFGFPPHNKNNVEKSSLNDSAFDSYNKWLAKTVHCPLISDIRDYIYNAEYFDNTDYHLNTVGREMHSKQLAEDIKAAKIGIK